MFSLDWHLHFFGECIKIAEKSKDPSTKCGATLIRPNKTIASKGYNGFPMGMYDNPARYANRDFKYRYVMHAEINAITFCQDPVIAGYVLYTWPLPPCCRCVAQIIQNKIACVVAPDAGDTALWERHHVREAMSILVECGVKVRLVHPAKIDNSYLTSPLVDGIVKE